MAEPELDPAAPPADQSHPRSEELGEADRQVSHDDDAHAVRSTDWDLQQQAKAKDLADGED